MVKIQDFKLIEKKKLTYEIFELVFECKEEIEFSYGQFITFLLPKIGGRAYSILKLNKNKITLIIKKREIENGGRGGSKFICQLEIGDILSGVGPAGHFQLKKNEGNKLFLGTGTGFVPLYNQINGAIQEGLNGELMLIFGVREEKDLFYLEQLEKLKENNSKFDYKIYLSNSLKNNFEKGYITNYLTKEKIKKYKDFYICGIPVMIKSSKETLKRNGIKKENIFTEEY